MKKRNTWRTPPTVAELRRLSPNDPAVLALSRELAAEPAELPPAPAAWSDDSGEILSDIIGPAWSPREANELLRAVAAAPPSLEERVEALELELREIRRRSAWRRLSAWLRRPRSDR